MNNSHILCGLFARAFLFGKNNMSKQNKIIGLIGGMGPYASSYFYKLLLNKSSGNRGAKNNNDFPEILIDSVPVPDFISDIKNLKIAKKILIDRVKKMNNYGVNTISMVCNTGHILYDELVKNSKVNFYSMINLVSKEIVSRKYKKVGILATPMTIKYDLYGKELSKYGIEVFYSTKNTQKLHESIIRDMIAGIRITAKLNKLEKLTKKLIKKNDLNGIILACTELPLVFPKNKFTNVIDCMDVLADKLLERYYN